MRPRELERAARAGQTRAERQQPKMETAVGDVLNELLDVAATRFEAKATVHLLAAGEGGWTPPADDEVLPLDEVIGRYRGKTDPVREAAVADYFAAFGQVAARYGVRANWTLTNPLFAAQLDKVASNITAISDTTREQVRAVIAKAYEDGLSVPDTASAIRDYAGFISESRAVLIARTEFAGLVNGGSLAATSVVAEATESTYWKIWLTAPGAEYPRHEDYEGLDGQTVPLDGVFDVGGEQLAYPGDPDGEPAEVCNCRCDLLYTEKAGGD